METHHITQQAKGLKGRPGVRMNLGGRYVERTKDAHRERVERQRHVKIRKKTSIHIKEGGTGTRSPHTYPLGRPTRHDVKIIGMTARL